MRPPKAASEIAAAAYERLPSGSKPNRLVLAIATGGELTSKEINQVASSFQALQADAASELAGNLLGGDPMRRAVETATFKNLNDATGRAVKDIETRDEVARRETHVAVELGWESALQRVGRAKTKASGDPELIELEPAEVAHNIQAAGVNVPQLITGPITDAVAKVEKLWVRAWPDAIKRLETILGVEYDEATFATVEANARRAATHLKTSMIDELNSRLTGDTRDRDPAEYVPDNYAIPANFVSDATAVAGGAPLTGSTVLRDVIGRPLAREGTPAGDGLLTGVAGLDLIDQAIRAYRTEPITAAARRRAGARISNNLSDDLRTAATLAGVRRTNESVWTLNVHGSTETHFQPHVQAAGTVVSDPGQLAASAPNPDEWPRSSFYHPGDHRHCKCGWKPRVVYRR